MNSKGFNFAMMTCLWIVLAFMYVPIIAIIAIVLGLAVVGVGAVMIFLFAGNEDCDMVVESYLDYLSGKEDDVDDFISVAYLGGGFENVVNGELAKKANEAYCKALFAGADMGGMY